jgi:hypothetical protein
MKIEIDLNEISYNYLMELAKDYETTPDEIVAGLLIGFALKPMIPKKIKIKKEKNKDEKRKHKLEKSNKK